MNDSLPVHFAASGLVLRNAPDRQILLVHHRNFNKHLYPGGHIEPHESPDMAVLREVLEETGIAVAILENRDHRLADIDNDVHVLHTPYIVLCEFINELGSPHYHVDLVYLCIPESPIQEPGESEDVHSSGYFTRLETEQLNMFPNFRPLLARIFSDETVWVQVPSKGE